MPPPPAGQAPRPTFAAWARALGARFDGAALRPPPPGAPAAMAPAKDHAALQAWCLEAAGDGRSPWWRPWAWPQVPHRFTVALWTPDAPTASAQQLESFARHLDGSDQLARAGRAAGLWLRLRVKLHDAWAWRARRPSDPWDVGWLIGDAQAWQRFLPRRATLIVLDEALSEAALREAVLTLQARSAAYRHPVRLLIVGRGSSDALAWSRSPGSSVAIREIRGSRHAGEHASRAGTSSADR